MPHQSAVTARAVVAALVAQGFDSFAYCPGSRNAPFAYALAEADRRGLIRLATFVDERAAGFWAVGVAAGGGRPVVVVTSGTAAAELHPALEEARLSHHALVAVTADRPAELIGVGASQTTWQDGLFGRSVLESVSLPAAAPHAEAAAQRIAVLAKRESGPVHLNVALREPLTPSGAETWPEIRQLRYIEASPQLPTWSQCVNGDLETVVIAGTGADPQVVAAAQEAGIPVLAEPTVSGGLPHSPLVSIAPPAMPAQVVVTGRPTLSRAVAAIAAQAERKVVVSPSLPWPDPDGTADVVVPGLAGPAPSASPQWTRLWEEASRLACAALPTTELGLLTAAQTLWETSSELLLWLGASNVVRAFDITAPNKRSPAYSNRGLAGIDGTIASGLGLGAATGIPVRIVLGDLTFAYDMNSLAARPGEGPAVQVVVLDDGGGAIFASLEHGQPQFAELYERFFAVTQTMDVVEVARACGWQAQTVQDLPSLREVLSEPVVGRSLIHVPIPRPNVELDRLQRTFRKYTETYGELGAQ